MTENFDVVIIGSGMGGGTVAQELADTGARILIVERGDLIHIPRFTDHRSRAVDGPAVFFTVKSPAGDGDLNQDYHKADGAEKAEEKYPGKK